MALTADPANFTDGSRCGLDFCCRGGTTRLLGTGAGVIFKGSGFYETDYKKKNGSPSDAPEAESDKKPETTAAKSESTSSDTPKGDKKKGSGSGEAA